LIGGQFTQYNGVARNRIARLNANGSLDTSFNPGTGANFQFHVWTLAVQADGKIMIGGFFTQYNGVGEKQYRPAERKREPGYRFQSRYGGKQGCFDHCRTGRRKNHDRGIFLPIQRGWQKQYRPAERKREPGYEFNPGTGANSNVRTLATQPDGKIMIGGDFTSYNGVDRKDRPAELRWQPGYLDFNPGAGANNSVLTLAPVGRKILIGGSFTGYDGVSRVRINRIQNTVGPAPDTQAPVADVENLLPVEAQCLVNLADLSIPTATDNVDGTLTGYDG
jgi:hypothetical protein